MTVAVVGTLSLDFVDGGAPRIGGAPFYAARALRALGASAVIAAKCAAPDRHLLLPPLIRLGLPVHWQDSSVSAAFSFSYEHEQRRMSIEAIADPWSPAEAVTAVGDARWVQVAPLSRADFPAETLAALARGPGCCSTARAWPVLLGSARSFWTPTTTRPCCDPCPCSSSPRTRRSS